jgi:hypothetical protein
MSKDVSHGFKKTLVGVMLRTFKRGITREIRLGWSKGTRKRQFRRINIRSRTITVFRRHIIGYASQLRIKPCVFFLGGGSGKSNLNDLDGGDKQGR